MKCSQCNVTHTCEVWMMTTSFIIENPAVILPRNPAVLNWILLRKRFSNSAMFPVVTKSWTSPLVCSFYNTALWSILGLKVTFHPTFLRFSYTKTLSLLLHSPTIAPAYYFSILINGPETSKINWGIDNFLVINITRAHYINFQVGQCISCCYINDCDSLYRSSSILLFLSSAGVCYLYDYLQPCCTKRQMI